MELTEDGCMEMSASEPAPDVEEADVEETAQEHKLTLDNLANGFWFFKTAFDFDGINPSVIPALQLEWMVTEKLIAYRNSLEKWKGIIIRQKWWCNVHIVNTKCACLSCFPLNLLHLFHICDCQGRKTARQQDLLFFHFLSLLSVETKNEEDFYGDWLPLNEQEIVTMP